MNSYIPPQSNDELISIVARRRNYLGLPEFDERVLDVMKQVDRADFAPRDAMENVYEDEPIKIGNNQTCSQPSMVAAMATFMDLRPGLRVLEIGTGSGYSAAVTAELISPGGHLFSMEIVTELHEFAVKNLQSPKYLQYHCDLLEGDGSEGLPEHAPYDRIYFTAGVGKYFDEQPLLKQLEIGGIFLYPEAFGSLFLLKKTPGGIKRSDMRGVGFVYLRGKNSGFD